MIKTSPNFANKLIVALDFNNRDTAITLAKELSPLGVQFKIGLELYLATQGRIIEDLEFADIFLDLKFHDIPNTVKQACKTVLYPNVKILNLHASGGSAMMMAACDALRQEASKQGLAKPKLIAVTVLTSLDNIMLHNDFNLNCTANDLVKRLSVLAQKSGLDGVVASANEATQIKEICGQDFLVITPGIRLENAQANDQKRILTPYAAITAGSDYLVVGRNITQSVNKIETTKIIISEITKALT